MGEKLSQKFGYTLAEVVWAVREMAITLEDVLARRVRMLFVDAREAMAAAPKAAAIMARTGPRPGMDRRTGESFTDLAKNYILSKINQLDLSETDHTPEAPSRTRRGFRG